MDSAQALRNLNNAKKDFDAIEALLFVSILKGQEAQIAKEKTNSVKSALACAAIDVEIAGLRKGFNLAEDRVRTARNEYLAIIDPFYAPNVKSKKR